MSNDRCDCYECISRREPRDAATHVDGREAPMEACEMPASSGGAEGVATVERCARAALDGYEGNDPPMYSSDWGQLPEDDRDAWREVARAVLAAARGGK